MSGNVRIVEEFYTKSVGTLSLIAPYNYHTPLYVTKQIVTYNKYHVRKMSYRN